MTIAERIAAAHAAAADLTPVGGVSGVVSGVPCLHVPLPQPWATQARPLLVPPSVADLADATRWLAGHSRLWTVVTRGGWVRHPAFAGFQPWLTLPAYHLRRLTDDGPRPPADLVIDRARDAADFLAVYGADLAPLVTAGHLTAPGYHYLVARLAGTPVGCARVQVVAGTAYVSAVTVLPAYRRRGIGAAMSVSATRLGQSLADLVWLHAAEHARRLYERLGYVFLADHVVLIHPAVEALA